ncbi:fatty acid desaturase family protein [Micromonospora nigra]|nr:fatty acid desaturase family protein [Micromonospora nigra]
MEPSTVETGYRRGYRNPIALRDAIARAHATNVWRTTAVAVLDHLTIPVVLLAATSPAVRHAGWLVICTAVLLGVVVAARQLRALECLVHEASHFNWSRRHRTLGDVLAAVLAGVPTGARIADYRQSHLVHHGRFGTAADPDRQRYEQLDLEDLDRSDLGSYAVGLLCRFVPYQRGWLDTLGSAPGTALLPFAWCAVVIVLPGWLLGGPVWAGSAALAWLVAHLVALPVVRFIGESSEHVYREADTVFAATVSNLGLAQRLLIHPHGDGYHTIHHMWPGVPHHQLAKLHRVLLSEDDEYRSKIRYRTRVRQRPRTGWTENRATA